MKKKYFLIVVLAIFVLFFVGLKGAKATSIQELQTQIAQLISQITALQSQQSSANTVNPAQWCHTFNQNLGYAQSGTAEVGYLHTALDKQGISYAPDTGNTYSGGTMLAVKQFQKKYDIVPAVGYFGTLTRTKLNSLYKCSSITSEITQKDTQNIYIISEETDISFLNLSQIKELAQTYNPKINEIKKESVSGTSLPSQKFSDLDNMLDDYKIPDEVQKKLDTINAKAPLWTANYNKVFVKSDQEKQKLANLESDDRIKSLLKGKYIFPDFKKPSYSFQTFLQDNYPVERSGLFSGAGTINNFSDSSFSAIFDWRNVGGKNYITPIKDQGTCGSCWAFGAVAALEGGIEVYYNDPSIAPDLSEEDLASCYISRGCSGGTTEQIKNLFNDYFLNTGVTNESCFPYTANDNICFSKCESWQNYVWKTDSSYQSLDLTSNNIENIKNVLINKGPVEVGMTVYTDFFTYSGGIYSHTENTIVGLHAVTIIGYGIENDVPYWIVKNSWGINWGEAGYFRIRMGDSQIDRWFAFVPGIPFYTQPTSKICSDNDGDGYCYWGTEAKPATGCPSSCDSNTIEDCDDSDTLIYSNCGQLFYDTGVLNVSSVPDGVDVYVEELDDEKWNLLGQTPISLVLQTGIRSVKLTTGNYKTDIEQVKIEKNQTVDLNASLVPSVFKISRMQNFYRNSFIVEDINNDGSQEIVLTESNYFSNSAANVYVLDSNGSVLPGWPQQIEPSVLSSYYFGGSPVLKDINKDGIDEIIIMSGSKAYIFDIYGEMLPGFPLDVNPLRIESSWMWSQVSVGDIDGDGSYDFFATLYNPSKCLYSVDCYNDKGGVRHIPGVFYAFNTSGKMLYYEFLDINAWMDSPTVGDLNGDGKDEVFVLVSSALVSPAGGSRIYSFGESGILEGWPLSLSSDSFGSEPAIKIADMNNDGRKELVAVYSNFSGEFVSFISDNLSMTTKRFSSGPSLWKDFVVTDLNNDGQKEIIFLSKNGLFVLDNGGNVLSKIGVGNYEFISPIRIGDVFGNDDKEIILAFGDKILVFDINLNLLAEQYISLNNWPNSFDDIDGAQIADFNKNFKSDILISTNNGSLYYWEPGDFYKADKNDWPFYQYDTQHTGCYDCTPSICTPSWNCTAWSTCTNNQKTRTCTDTNSCGTTIDKPATTQTCSIALTYPNGGQMWNTGKTYLITWTSSGVDKIMFELEKTGSGQTWRSASWILSAYGDGRYSWLLPSDVPSGSDYKIKVWDYVDPSISDTSDNIFTIRTCAVKWDCSDWSACANGQQVRTCTDLHNCGVDTDKPVESQSCSTTYCSQLYSKITASWKKSCGDAGYDAVADIDKDKTVGLGDLSYYSANQTDETWCQQKLSETASPCTCTPSWNCTAWSSCKNYRQIRTCADSNNCGVTTTNKPAETQACTITYCTQLYFKITASWEKSCGEAGYDAVADINKNKTVDLSDLSFYGLHATDETWCQQKLSETASPCEITYQYQLDFILKSLASISQQIKELMKF